MDKIYVNFNDDIKYSWNMAKFYKLKHSLKYERIKNGCKKNKIR